MKFTGVSVFLLLAANSEAYQSTAFVPKKPIGMSSFVPRSTAATAAATATSYTARTAASLSMLVETSGGMEELQELTEKADQTIFLGKQIRRSPNIFKLAGYASIPVSALLGFGLVPSRRIAAHAAGALVTGIAGAVGKSRLDSLTQSGAKPALAQAIVDAGLEDVESTQAAVRAVQDSFGLSDEDLEILCTEIYASYLHGMVKFQPTAKTAEIKELQKLKQALSLENMAVGEAHAAAAAEWYRQTCLFTPTEELEDPKHPDRMAMDKLLFLTERALSEDSPQAFNFEMTRVAKAVGLTLPAAMERVASVVEPFYHRALQSTRSKLGSNAVSSDMLKRARETLGIKDEVAADMHVFTFNQEVRVCLGLPERKLADDDDDEEEDEDEMPLILSSLKFSDESLERLDQLREILGLSETDMDYEIISEASPLYQATALAAMKDVLTKTKTPEEAWDIMENRREELLMHEDSTKALISSMVMQALGGPLEETNRFAKVNNEAATYDHLLEALESKSALVAILEKSGWGEEFNANFDETFCNPWDKQSANGFLSTEERIKLYRIFVGRSVRKAPEGRLTDEIFEQIHAVKGLLGITDQQAEIEARAAFGPQLQKTLNHAMLEITADYTEELVENMQKEVDALMENYRLSEDYLRESGASFYAKAVEIISNKSPGGVPTKALFKALEALREMFHLKTEETYPAHMEHFGSVYKKAVLEAMGTTGVIRPGVRESLDELKERLSVSEENSKTLFLQAIEEKMKPAVEWIGSEMERTMLSQQQLSERRGKDMGEDVFQSGKGANGVLGLGAEVNIMSDIMELIDFYKENEVAAMEEVGTKTVEKKGEDGELSVEEIPDVKMVYPITALGLNAIDQQMAELLYRQFVVSSFTTQGPNAKRYEENREFFAGILGLTEDKIDEINNTIGSTVYDNLVSNAMKTKGSMDQQDMMVLANVQMKLGLSSEQGEKMLAQTQKKLLSEEINGLMDNPSPAGIKAFREKCNSMGMDIQADVGVSKSRLTRMFESEITPGLKSGEIVAENADILVEVQESLGIEAEECESMFEALLMRLSKNALSLISGELLRGREENAVDLIKELVRYGAFTGGDLGLEVDEATAYKIVNIYDALDFEGQDDETVSANKEILEAVVGLSS